jgi:hypothetical protein
LECKNPHFLNVLLSFWNFFLHDDGVILVFYLDDPNVLRDITRYLSSMNFKIHMKLIANIGFKLSNPQTHFQTMNWFSHLILLFLIFIEIPYACFSLKKIFNSLANLLLCLNTIQNLD